MMPYLTLRVKIIIKYEFKNIVLIVREKIEVFRYNKYNI